MTLHVPSWCSPADPLWVQRAQPDRRDFGRGTSVDHLTKVAEKRRSRRQRRPDPSGPAPLSDNYSETSPGGVGRAGALGSGHDSGRSSSALMTAADPGWARAKSAAASTFRTIEPAGKSYALIASVTLSDGLLVRCLIEEFTRCLRRSRSRGDISGLGAEPRKNGPCR